MAAGRGSREDAVVGAIFTVAAVSGHWSLVVSLGIGLLIGTERERTKGQGPGRRPAGIRTFALVSLMGGLAAELDDRAVLAVGAGFVGLAAVASYIRRQDPDPGLTTEVALVVAFLLGALARDDTTLAAAIGVVVTILLASRQRMHTFVDRVISEAELHDALVLAAAAVVVWPLMPDRRVGPYGVINPLTIWGLVVIVMAISAFGYIARRALGPRFGLPVAGFAGGFVSAAATIGTMGGRAKGEPEVTTPAVAGALLANVATVVLMAVLLAITSLDALRELAVPLTAAGAAALGVGAIALRNSWRTKVAHRAQPGRAFDVRTAVAFALTLTAVLLVSAVLTDLLGSAGLVAGVAVAGFADTHSAAISAAALAAAGKASPEQAAIAVLAALSTNTVTKFVVAWLAGGRAFAVKLVPGLLAIPVLAWVGLIATRAV